MCQCGCVSAGVSARVCQCGCVGAGVSVRVCQRSVCDNMKPTAGEARLASDRWSHSRCQRVGGRASGSVGSRAHVLQFNRQVLEQVAAQVKVLQVAALIESRRERVELVAVEVEVGEAGDVPDTHLPFLGNLEQLEVAHLRGRWVASGWAMEVTVVVVVLVEARRWRCRWRGGWRG